jgi:general secretion pathway protein G
MKFKHKKSELNAFTLVEILVVVTIISMLISVVAVSYGSISKSARDARRKTDLEQIRAAAEQYRSNNGSYPNNLSTICANGSPISDPAPATSIYLSASPKDPRTPKYNYYCNVSPLNLSDYTIGAFLEGTASSCSTVVNCGTANCNYCLGPYGQK